jgi:hypothetical protein
MLIILSFWSWALQRGCLTVLGVQWKLAIPKAEFRFSADTARKRVVDSRHFLSSARLAINVEGQFFGNCPKTVKHPCSGQSRRSHLMGDGFSKT